MATDDPNVKTSIKVVGINGTISIGKEFAGKQVLVEQREPGVWLVRTIVVMPENELGLHQSGLGDDLKQALAWAQDNLPRSSEPLELLEH